MTDRPILFSAPMVRALLDGRKTQTRRVLKPQPTMIYGVSPTFTGLQAVREGYRWRLYGTHTASAPFSLRFAVGDRLWVRETFSGVHPYDIFNQPPRDWSPAEPIWYWADGNPADGDWTKPRPGIHMPRWASRLNLTVTDVRVQRLQEISEADAVAEGMFQHPWDGSEAAGAWTGGIDFLHGNSARGAFFRTWEKINGAGSWAANPWVVALTFTVERRNIDEAKP